MKVLKHPRPTGRWRRHRRPQWLAVVTATLLVVALGAAGCSSSSGGGSTKPSTTLTMGIPEGVLSLNPAKDSYGVYPHSLSEATIIRANPDGTYSPNLAASWEYVGAGNKTFEFTLRPDLRFSDGSALDAAAAAEWMNYFRKSDSFFAAQLGPIKSITATSADTVRISLDAPNPDMPYYLSGPFNWGYLVSPKAISDPESLNTSTAGAGPYVLDATQTVAGSSYTYVQNEHYFAPSEIKYEKVVVKVLSSEASLAALRTGEIQVALGDYANVGAASDAGLEVYSVRANTTALTIFDREGKISEPLGDVRVRQALNYAIDRTAITNAIIGDSGEPTSEFGTTDGFDTSVQDYYTYDPDKAKSLLAEAGYPDGFTFTVFAETTPGTLASSTAQAMAQQFKDIGVTMKIHSVTASEYVNALFSGKFPAQVGDNPFLPQWVTYGTVLAPTAVVNPMKVSDPEIDAIAAEGATSSSPDSFWKQMSQMYTEKAVFAPVFLSDSFIFASKSVGGIVPTRKELIDPTVWFPQ
jgi:peptide/nickel transport system substrate-binding protein